MPKTYGLVNRAVPAGVAAGVYKDLRLGPTGELFSLNLSDPAALGYEAAVFAATNPTWGTALTLSAAARTTFSATEALLLMRNTSSDAVTGKCIIPLAIRLTIVGTNTAGTNVHFGIILDNANRYSSGGTLLTASNVRSDNNDAAVAQVYVGNVTAAAAVSPRQIGRWNPKTAAAPAMALGDEFVFAFGSFDTGPGSASGVTTGTAASKVCMAVPPVVIAPGSNHSMLLHYWSASQSGAPTAEVTVVWAERP